MVPAILAQQEGSLLPPPPPTPSTHSPERKGGREEREDEDEVFNDIILNLTLLPSNSQVLPSSPEFKFLLFVEPKRKATRSNVSPSLSWQTGQPSEHGRRRRGGGGGGGGGGEGGVIPKCNMRRLQ